MVKQLNKLKLQFYGVIKLILLQQQRNSLIQKYLLLWLKTKLIKAHFIYILKIKQINYLYAVYYLRFYYFQLRQNVFFFIINTAMVNKTLF